MKPMPERPAIRKIKRPTWPDLYQRAVQTLAAEIAAAKSEAARVAPFKGAW